MAREHATSRFDIVSPLLLHVHNFNLSQPVSNALQIGWEEVLGMPVNSADCVHQPNTLSEEIEQFLRGGSRRVSNLSGN